MNTTIITTNPLITTLQVIYNDGGRSPQVRILQDQVESFEIKVLPWLREYAHVSDRWCDLNAALEWLMQKWIRFDNWDLPQLDDYLYYQVSQAPKFSVHPNRDDEIAAAIRWGSERVQELAAELHLATVSDLVLDTIDRVANWPEATAKAHQQLLQEAGEVQIRYPAIWADSDYQAMLGTASQITGLQPSTPSEVEARQRKKLVADFFRENGGFPDALLETIERRTEELRDICATAGVSLRQWVCHRVWGSRPAGQLELSNWRPWEGTCWLSISLGTEAQKSPTGLSHVGGVRQMDNTYQNLMFRASWDPTQPDEGMKMYLRMALATAHSVQPVSRSISMVHLYYPQTPGFRSILKEASQ